MKNTNADTAAKSAASLSPFNWRVTPPDTDSTRPAVARGAKAAKAVNVSEAAEVVEAAGLLKPGHSLLGQMLQRSARRSGALQLEPRAFHVYAKAKP